MNHASQNPDRSHVKRALNEAADWALGGDKQARQRLILALICLASAGDIEDAEFVRNVRESVGRFGCRNMFTAADFDAPRAAWVAFKKANLKRSFARCLDDAEEAERLSPIATVLAVDSLDDGLGKTLANTLNTYRRRGPARAAGLFLLARHSLDQGRTGLASALSTHDRALIVEVAGVMEAAALAAVEEAILRERVRDTTSAMVATFRPDSSELH